ncbi:hypothetical protein [Limnofasciculus baicalensis]|uniref:Uncharacterized protein n=1 Tax=Limnofasciculus baicalensis BBK-W-15 TaxID=2699891 RepID=A0AAE3GR64_9CYAN|nr:hypothetical protein [Limnofasciculus baicalensis]MCP2729034.1 hypothetical protein [Limnofasciculus baicalensis BBK-W-15]
MELATLSAAAITTLIVTKALEKSGELLGENGMKQVSKFMQLLREKFLPTADKLAVIEQLPPSPDKQNLALQVSQDVAAAASKDTDVAKAVEDIAKAFRQAEANKTTVYQNVIQKDNQKAVNVGHVDTFNM